MNRWQIDIKLKTENTFIQTPRRKHFCKKNLKHIILNTKWNYGATQLKTLRPRKHFIFLHWASSIKRQVQEVCAHNRAMAGGSTSVSHAQPSVSIVQSLVEIKKHASCVNAVTMASYFSTRQVLLLNIETWFFSWFDRGNKWTVAIRARMFLL